MPKKAFLYTFLQVFHTFSNIFIIIFLIYQNDTKKMQKKDFLCFSRKKSYTTLFVHIHHHGAVGKDGKNTGCGGGGGCNGCDGENGGSGMIIVRYMRLEKLTH
jgi:hypothetical protein